MNRPTTGERSCRMRETRSRTTASHPVMQCLTLFSARSYPVLSDRLRRTLLKQLCTFVLTKRHGCTHMHVSHHSYDPRKLLWLLNSHQLTLADHQF